MAKSSVTNVKVNNTSQQAIKDQMAANSAAWHTADADTRKQLEQANKDLAAQLGGLSFDSGSGTWSGEAGGSGDDRGSTSTGLTGSQKTGNNVTTSSAGASKNKTQTTYTDILNSSKPAVGTSSGSNAGLTQNQTTKPASSADYTKYTGGNAALDAELTKYSAAYQQARARALAGDHSAVMDMRNANDEANKLRNQYGYAAEYADEDINNVKTQIGYYADTGGRDLMGVGSDGSIVPPVDTSPAVKVPTVTAPAVTAPVTPSPTVTAPVVTTPTTTAPSYSDLLKEQQDAYAQIQAEQERAKRAAVEQAIGSLTQQKGEVGQGYADLFRQLYIDRRMAEKRLPQQMAAMGYTGGLTESSLLKMMTDHAEALRQGEQERINTLSDIDRAISDTELQGDISIADLAAQNAKEKLATYTSIIQAMQAQANADRQFALQQEELAYTKLLNQLAQQNADREFEYNKSQDEQAQENWLATMNRQETLDQLERDDLDYSRKLALAQYLFENSGDASGLRALGYNDSQIAALQKQWAAEMTPKTEVEAEETPEYEPKLTYSQVMEQVNTGNLTPQVLADYEYYMGETLSGPGTPEQNEYGYSTQVTSGVKASEWAMVKNNIATNLRNGNFEAVEKYLDQVSGGMSAQQWNEVAQLLERYGYQNVPRA